MKAVKPHQLDAALRIVLRADGLAGNRAAWPDLIDVAARVVLAADEAALRRSLFGGNDDHCFGYHGDTFIAAGVTAAGLTWTAVDPDDTMPPHVLTQGFEAAAVPLRQRERLARRGFSLLPLACLLSLLALGLSIAGTVRPHAAASTPAPIRAAASSSVAAPLAITSLQLPPPGAGQDAALLQGSAALIRDVARRVTVTGRLADLSRPSEALTVLSSPSPEPVASLAASGSAFSRNSEPAVSDAVAGRPAQATPAAGPDHIRFGAAPTPRATAAPAPRLTATAAPRAGPAPGSLPGLPPATPTLPAAHPPTLATGTPTATPARR